jgi:MFS family permease
MSPEKIKRKKRLFYGWYVLAAGFLILFFNAGARFSIGVMFKPMIGEFGWSRAAMSLGFFLYMTFFALSLTVIGRFYDRYGPKWVIVISTLFLSLGYMSISVINSLWQFYICYGFLAAIGLGGTSLSLMAVVISKWFEKGRGLATSLALSGSCLGQFVLVPLITIFVLRSGWRAAHLVLGLIMLVLNISLALAVIKGDPDRLGQKPYGSGSGDRKEASNAQSPTSANPRDLDLREAMRTYSFWLYFVVMFICGSGDFLVATHLIPLVTDHGISPTTAGNMLALYGLMSLGGILIAGPVSDLIGTRLPIAFTFVMRIFLFIMIIKYQNVISFYILALAFGFTHLVTAPLTPILLGRLYGFSHIGLISGVIFTIHYGAGGFWAYVGGLIFDQTGSYRLAFILSAIMALIAFFGTLLIRERRHHGVR